MNNRRLFWLPKRSHQVPQTKWIEEFVFDDLLKDLKSDDEFFDLNIFEKKNLMSELALWKNGSKDNSVFPWYLLMSYHFVRSSIMDK